MCEANVGFLPAPRSRAAFALKCWWISVLTWSRIAPTRVKLEVAIFDGELLLDSSMTSSCCSGEQRDDDERSTRIRNCY